MSTAMSSSRTSRWRWWHLPAFAVFLGALCGGAIWIGGDHKDGMFAFGVLAVLAVLIAVGGRSEMIRGLRGDGRDEYWARVDLLATTFAGIVAITAIIGMCLWEWAHGRDGTPYSQLGAITGVAYLLGLALVRWRS
jgi:hypothetical protein